MHWSHKPINMDVFGGPWYNLVKKFTQLESQVNMGNGAMGAVGGGRDIRSSVHVLRTLHHGGVQVAWARATYVLQRRLKFIPHIRLFAILKPAKKSAPDFPGARSQDFNF